MPEQEVACVSAHLCFAGWVPAAPTLAPPTAPANRHNLGGVRVRDTFAGQIEAEAGHKGGFARALARLWADA
jgi:hypothetical protein